MSQFAEAFTRDVTKQYPYVFSDGYQACDEAATHGVPFAVMVLDKLGTVRYCDGEAARLFRTSARTLVGRQVKELIPDLPFNSRTPAYNVAYATFWATEGPQRGFCGLDCQGSSFGLQVALDRLALQKYHLIIVVLSTTGCRCSASGTVRRCPGNGVDACAAPVKSALSVACSAYAGLSKISMQTPSEASFTAAMQGVKGRRREMA